MAPKPSEKVLVQQDPVELLDEPRRRAGDLVMEGLAEAVLSIEITTPERLATLEREWHDLSGRALADNAFLEPSLIAAAGAAGAAEIAVLLAWSAPRPGAPSRLVGLWAMARQQAFPLLPVRMLKTPVLDHAFLGTPVLDRDDAVEALASMLDAVAADLSLPKLLSIGCLDTAGPVAAVFADVLTRRGSPCTRLETRLRPSLLKAVPGCSTSPVAPSRAKALRKKQQRLAKQGTVACTRHDSGAEVGPAIEEFLALEASGWKGRRSSRGQAILRAPALAAFFRSAVTALATRRQARITALRLDGRAIAMQVTIHSGETAFTWKSAYDEALRACAPGLLLHQEVTCGLLADPTLSAADSCNHHDTGHMAEFWAGRREVSDFIVDVRPRRTAVFGLVSTVELVHRRLREAARHGRDLLRAARHRSALPNLETAKPGGGPP